MYIPPKFFILTGLSGVNLFNMNKKDVVINFLTYFRDGNIDRIPELLTDDLRFTGPLLECDSKNSYIRKLRADPPEKAGCEIIKILQESNEVSVLYKYIKPSSTVIIAQFCRVEDGISQMDMVFYGNADT